MLGAGLMLAMMTVACSGEPDNGMGKKLSGLIVQQGSEKIVFLGTRSDLKAQLSDSLNGGALKEDWYRAHIAPALMPGDSERKKYDLAKTPGIRVVFNFPIPVYAAKKGYKWAQMDATTPATSGSLKLSGVMEISGKNVVKDSTSVAGNSGAVGVAYEVEWLGQAKGADGSKVGVDAGWTVGALAERVRGGNDPKQTNP